MTKALITGINGQDGSYLTEHLLKENYEVAGLVRRSSVAENQTFRINNLLNDIKTYYGDLTDADSLAHIVSDFKPDIVFNLAAQSHVRLSFSMPAYTAQVNAIGALNVFESIRKYCPNAKVYQASSSEMFGSSVDEDAYQRETTPMTPVSPYGCSKLYAYSAARNYRKAYNLFISNGILFNHESPRRGTNFVTAKVVQGALKIKSGKIKHLELGNLDSYRDWGHSYDYTRAMLLLLKHNCPEDIVISSGEARSVRDLCEVVFKKLDMDYKEYVKVNEKFIRPEELPYLRGDCRKGKKLLGWKPKYNFETLIEDMIDHISKN
ncbi:MAG: GDP-mannose 4,6-dehydratase [Prochlorococcus marinus XMU1422]|nr:GDP-mannose 4,6-dehydratase [Prochlorococcus marinus XMU1421]MBO7013276.1 GDP-mannose 4,6-dehydratase [Prochlorococcus marinus XMU1422]MCR8542269.1 GDP-mannose 4,6-dehydratase [Prochlorococcus marinus XMU1423]